MTRNALLMMLLVGVLSFLLSACAVPPATETDESIEVLRWPVPPYPPRIEWVKEIRAAEDHGIDRGFFRRISESISGVRSQPIVKPYGVHADAKGRLIVADPGASVVHLFDTERNRYQALRGGKGTPFSAPIGVTGDHLGNIYVTDSGAGTIYRYNIKEQSYATFPSRQLERPTGIVYSPRHEMLFVSETLAHRIVAFDLQGAERFRIGQRGGGDVQFNYPTDLFIDSKGQLYVTDALNQRIQILTPEGQLLGKFGEGGDTTGYFAKPKGVAVDSLGHIYVCDALLDAVQIFDSSGRLLLYFGGTGSRRGEFWMPTGIFIDADNYIYVADSFNRRIQVFRYVGKEG
ncbi:MAG: SMP-30/gluconolactonase/LRE family protein [Desulfuromonadales bacterium]|nr:SMP-30/gluconolactonase/LRE family protein [Desulfuromonadales bacterium]